MKLSDCIPLKAVPDGHYSTMTGKAIDLSNPKSTDIDIEDIANSLSLQVRWGGHCNRFYSVAQHSILVAALAPEHLKKEAFAHDFSEAYLGDVIKPLKNLLPQYEELECRWSKVLSDFFGLNPEKLKEVKVYDLEALHLEHEALQLNDARNMMAAMQRADMILAKQEVFYRPLVAKMEFLRIFQNLFPNQNRYTNAGN